MGYYGLIIPSVFPTGVFIQDIKQTASSNESEGINTMTVTLTNQQKAHFNVKNGKQGSATEATTQMKQYAKNYIDSELVEQKKMLEQAIENGKTSINNSTAQADKALQQKVLEASSEFKNLIKTSVDDAKNHINSKLSDASKELQKSIDTKVIASMNIEKNKLQAEITKTLINLLKNGYIQWPGMPRPDTIFNFSGYRWAEVNYDGCFFRAKGTNAASFNDGEQGDAIRNIYADIDTAFSTNCYYKTRDIEEGENFPGFTNGAFKITSSSGQTKRVVTQNVSYKNGSHMIFSASLYVPTAKENRPRNRTIIIWKLEKI